MALRLCVRLSADPCENAGRGKNPRNPGVRAMCELLAMSSRQPAWLSFSLSAAGWRALAEGEVIAVRGGQLRARRLA